VLFLEQCISNAAMSRLLFYNIALSPMWNISMQACAEPMQ